MKTTRTRVATPVAAPSATPTKGNLPDCVDGGQHAWQDRDENRWGVPDKWCSSCGLWLGDYVNPEVQVAAAEARVEDEPAEPDEPVEDEPAVEPADADEPA